MIKPLVSILCPTYNHELYIAEAIESFLMQKTDFDFEIIIHDDASTDKTVEIVKLYESKYPEKFNNIYQNENQFSKDTMSVSRILFNSAKGKYIALCEGDDYWTDPYKLKKQVDFLDENKDFLAVAHNTNIVNMRSNIFAEAHSMFHIKDYPEILKVSEIISKKVPFHTTSLLFNNVCMQHFKFNSKIFSGDLCLFFYIFLKTKIYVLSDYMSVYRINNGGITFEQSTTNYNQLLLNRVYLWNYLNKLDVDNLYKKEINILISDYVNDLVWKNKNKNANAISKLFFDFLFNYNFKYAIVFVVKLIKQKINARINNHSKL